MPEKILGKLKNRILPQYWICFYCALAAGLAAHLYKLTGWLPNWDSLVFRYDSQNMVSLGRWFLPVVCSVSSFYDLPFLNGLLSIVFHALGAVCICRILNVRGGITAFLTGSVIVTFPTVTSVLMYNYVADGYAIAFFLSCLAAVCMSKDKPRYIEAAVLIALSAGIYQAYITVTVMLMLLHLIDDCIYNGKDFKFLVTKGFKVLAAGVGGMVLYWLILKAVLLFTAQSLGDYQGIDSAFSLASLDFAGSLYKIKETFVTYFFDFSKGRGLTSALNTLLVICTVMHYIKYAAINGIFRSPLKIIFMVIMSFMLISGGAVLAFINAGVDYHTLMLMGYSVFYVFFIILYERGCDRSERVRNIKCWTVLVLTLGIIFNHIVIANVSYHKAQIAYEKSYGVLIRIADRIEQLPQSGDYDKILVIGSLDGSESYSVSLPPDITGITDGYIIRKDDETVGQSVLCSALNDYCHKDYKFLSGKEKNKFLAKDSVQKMGIWPDMSSVSAVDGVIVVKLGAESE